MRRVCVCAWALSLVLAGCGPSVRPSDTTAAQVEDPCADTRARAGEAGAALDACRAAPVEPPTWAHRATFDSLRAALEAQRERVATQGEGEPTAGESLSQATWALLDEIAAEVSDHELLDRMEDAAEALLRTNGGEPAIVAQALAALDALRARLEPVAPPRCGEESARAEAARTEAERCAEGS